MGNLVIIIILLLIAVAALIILLIMFFRRGKNTASEEKNSSGTITSEKKGAVLYDEKGAPVIKTNIPETIVSFLQSKLNDSKVLIHYTYSKETAESINKTGFKFADSLYNTSQEVSPDLVDLNYRLQLYRKYGKYLIVIAIPKEVYDFTLKEILKSEKDVLVELVLSDHVHHDELKYTLPYYFIYGYVDFETSTIIKNELYLKDFDFETLKADIVEFIGKYTPPPRKIINH